MKKWIFRLSVTFNVIFLLTWCFNSLNKPSYRLGRLEKDITIGSFMGDSIVFTLPKGLTVRNASERGINAIGQFENERFQIVISSDDWDLVSYDLPIDSLASHGNYYSADFDKYDQDQ